MTAIGYARLSTAEQDLALQLDALREAGCTRILEDRGVPGARADRLGLAQALGYVGSLHEVGFMYGRMYAR